MALVGLNRSPLTFFEALSMASLKSYKFADRCFKNIGKNDFFHRLSFLIYLRFPLMTLPAGFRGSESKNSMYLGTL
jgi:hypothetical protein